MKPTWTKVYSGPGYPIDPKKQAERGVIVTQDGCFFLGVDMGYEIKDQTVQLWEVPKPNQAYAKFVELISSGQIAFPKEPLSDEAYSCVMIPTEPEDLPNCNCPACVTFDFLQALNAPPMNHQRRSAMIQTQDFQSRLMAIEVKSRQVLPKHSSTGSKNSAK